LDEKKSEQRIREKIECLAKAKARYKSQIYDLDVHQLWLDTLRTIPKFKSLFENKSIKKHQDNYYEVLRLKDLETTGTEYIRKNKIKMVKKVVQMKVATTFDEEAEMIAKQLLSNTTDTLINSVQEVSVTVVTPRDDSISARDESMVNSSVCVDDHNNSDFNNLNSDSSIMLHDNEAQLDEASLQSDDRTTENEFYNDEMEIVLDPASKHLLKKNETHSLQNMHERLKAKAIQGPSDGLGPWTTVGNKQIEREHKKTFETTSAHYLPIHLPNYECIDNNVVATLYRIPVSITVKNPKPGKFGFKNSRVLVAFLKALQMAYSDTYLAPLSDEGEKILPNIVDPSSIDVEDKNLRPYMMEPIINSNDAFSTKIIILSNHPLKDYKSNPAFRNYIGEEGIMVDNNRLQTVQPENVGFLENVNKKEYNVNHSFACSSGNNP
jgi:hypothetical protein